MPNELKSLVVDNINDPETLLNLAKTSKVFYSIMRYSEEEICGNMCLAKFGDKMLSLALARSEAASASNKDSPGRLLVHIYEFVHYSLDQRIFGRIDMYQEFNLGLATDLFSFDQVVSRYATKVSKLALRRLPGNEFPAPCNEREVARIKKALYIFQLLHYLFFRGYDRTNMAEISRFSGWRHFWKRFAPWEMQQVRCVQELLAQHISKGIYNRFYPLIQHAYADILSSLQMQRHAATDICTQQGPGRTASPRDQGDEGPSRFSYKFQLPRLASYLIP